MLSENFWEGKHTEEDMSWLTVSNLGHYLLFFDLKGAEIETHRVLEIGVGLCVATAHLKKLVGDLWTVDVAPSAIRRARGIVKKNQSLHVEQALELPAGYFDVAFSYAVVQHLGDVELEHQLDYVLRALTPEGIFAVQFLTEKGTSDGMRTKGGVSISRTPAYFQQIVEGVHGKVIKMAKPLQAKKHPDIKWNGFIVGRAA